MWNGYALEIYSRDSERRLASHRVRKMPKWEQFLQQKDRDIILEHNVMSVLQKKSVMVILKKIASLKLSDCSCKMPTKGIPLCMLLNILVNILNIFFILVIQHFALFPEKVSLLSALGICIRFLHLISFAFNS